MSSGSLFVFARWKIVLLTACVYAILVSRLKKLTSSDMLGRMLSFDFATTMLCDVLVAFVTGAQADSGLDMSAIALAASALMGLMWILWSLYHTAGKGAARTCFNAGNVLSPTVLLHRDLELQMGEAADDLRLHETHDVGGDDQDLTSRLSAGALT